MKKNVDREVKVVALGGIEALLKAMQGHTSDVWLQGWTCSALSNLVQNADHGVKVVALVGWN